ncbi:hypothetical protein E2626_14240 [Jeotgalibacillus salarius]|uniref:Pycsar effector protein domain-containing protein n=1 Tax=Jeotgalibacillus salarius TaxID=546023 RepID=A0A4Y8LDD1_9BACL|nr:hypothetical protein E2626_14240 [Jeotgalibacillus salarius]
MQLDRHLDWIKSCDTKASIVLAVIGIFLSALTAEHSINMFGEIAESTIKNISFSNILYITFLVIAFSTFIYGVYNLIRVLTPRLSKEASFSNEIDIANSLYFFESISGHHYKDFKSKFYSRSKSDEIDDIIGQIYINANIATAKYHNYSKGIKFSFIGITAIVILFVFGIILVKAGGM